MNGWTAGRDALTPSGPHIKSTRHLFHVLIPGSQKLKTPQLESDWIERFEQGGETYDGISWGPTQVYHAFSFLANICSDSAEFQEDDFIVPRPSDSTLTSKSDGKTGPKDVSEDHPTAEEALQQAIMDTYGPKTYRWFSFDNPAMQAEAKQPKLMGQSWYSRLKAVCDTTMVLILNLHYLYVDADGKRQNEWTPEFVSKNIQRVITPPVIVRNKPEFKPFSVDKGASLVDWRDAFEDNDLLTHSAPGQVPTAIESIRRGEPAHIPRAALSAAVEHGDAMVESSLGEMEVRYTKHTGKSIPEGISPGQFASVIQYPSCPVTPLQADEFTQAFMGANVLGQARLMYERLKMEYVRLSIVKQHAEKAMKVVDDECRSLTDQVAAWENQQHEFETMSKSFDAKIAQKHALQRRVSALASDRSSTPLSNLLVCDSRVPVSRFLESSPVFRSYNPSATGAKEQGI